LKKINLDTTPFNFKNKKRKAVLKKQKKELKGNIRAFFLKSGIDMTFCTLTLVLLVIGLVMLFSASFFNAYCYQNGDSYFFIRNQLIWALLGVVVLFLTSLIDYNKLKKLAIPILFLSYLLLLAVLFMPVRNDVHRWIALGPFTFQASEITKFAVVLSFAYLISKNFKHMSTFRYGVFPFALIVGSTAFLLYLEPHISCLVIVVLLAGGMLYIGGIKLRWFGVVFIFFLAALAYLILSNKLSYANERIIGWLDPFNSTADTWQTRQGLYAIGSGGLLGLGLGKSRQKYLFIPEPQNDFIFSVVCEELGFIGALIILLLFAMLIWRGIVVSMRARDKFGALLGIGLTAQVGLQVILNIFVVTNTIPNTGISLPFFSYGGTALVMLLAQMGIVLSISRTANLEK
jgi:cell division protein FtsW